MKTNCILRASLHSLINSTPNSNSTTRSGKISRSATSRAKSYDTMRDRQTSNSSTNYPASRQSLAPANAVRVAALLSCCASSRIVVTIQPLSPKISGVF